jgi:hypothetical protein
MKKLIPIALSLIVAQLCSSALATNTPVQADSGNVLHFQFSPYTYHFSPSEDHKPVVMVGVERQYPNDELDGFTLFTNSFGQESVYIYPWGSVYKTVGGIQSLSFKWTAGLLYGYKEPFENKVPMNYKGFSPGLIVGLAYEFKPDWSAQLNMLGTAALMFQINMRIR